MADQDCVDLQLQQPLHELQDRQQVLLTAADSYVAQAALLEVTNQHFGKITLLRGGLPHRATAADLRHLIIAALRLRAAHTCTRTHGCLCGICGYPSQFQDIW